VRVLVADDSAVVREFLRELIDETADMIVVGMAVNGVEAVQLAKTLRPDLVTLDVNMPRLGGLEAARQIMAECPMPIAIVTGAPVGPGASTTFLAMDAGAVDVLAKPDRSLMQQSRESRVAFGKHLRNVAYVGVVGIRRGALPSPVPRAPQSTPPQVPALIPRHASVIAIGASTGGPPCIRTLLGELDPKKAPPILVAQHMSTQFLPGFADWLNGTAGFNVQLAQSGQRLVPGRVYVAPGDRHLVLNERARTALHDGPHVQYQRPSVDVLFNSVAAVYGGSAIGVLLTGMGRDGAEGLLGLYECGAATLSQDRDSSLVYGMPAAAVELGASRLSASPLHIGRLLRRVDWLNPSALSAQGQNSSRD
jgi:two-component system, chemotaxis family, protein-glutamate methylesterase/glutaminase